MEELILDLLGTMNAPEEITHVRASRSDMVVFILLVRTVNGGDNRGMIKRKDIWRVEMERMSKSKNKSTYVEYNDWICISTCW